MNKRLVDAERQRAILEFIRDYKRFLSEVERTTTPSGASPARRRDALREEGKQFEKLLLTIRPQ